MSEMQRWLKDVMKTGQEYHLKQCYYHHCPFCRFNFLVKFGKEFAICTLIVGDRRMSKANLRKDQISSTCSYNNMSSLVATGLLTLVTAGSYLLRLFNTSIVTYRTVLTRPINIFSKLMSDKTETSEWIKLSPKPEDDQPLNHLTSSNLAKHRYSIWVIDETRIIVEHQI